MERRADCWELARPWIEGGNRTLKREGRTEKVRVGTGGIGKTGRGEKKGRGQG